MSYAAVDRPRQLRLLSEELYISADPRQPDRPYATGQTLPFVIAQIGQAVIHYWIPISRQRESVEARFNRLVRTWKSQVGPTSSLTDMVMHPAYQQIIGMGREAIPLLLGELEREPDHWFWALKAITGVDPVAPRLKGKLGEMAKEWLKWGREQSFV